MKKSKKRSARIFSLLLILAMMCSLLPVGVFAQEAKNADETSTPIGTEQIEVVKKIDEKIAETKAEAQTMPVESKEVTDKVEITPNPFNVQHSEVDKGVPEAVITPVLGSTQQVSGSISGEGYSFQDGVLTITSNVGSTKWRTDQTMDFREVKSVEVKEGVTHIGNNAFASCTNLMSATMPSDFGLRSIGDGAFANCSSLKSVGILYGIESIGDAAFVKCTALEEIDISWDTIKSIGDRAFLGCTALTSVEIPKEVETIDSDAFAETNISTVIIPKTMKKISEGTFSGCKNLTYVAIPSSVEVIKSEAFKECENLEYILVDRKVPPTIQEDTFDQSLKKEAQILVPTGYENAYKEAENWSKYSSFIKSDDRGYTFKDGVLTINSDDGSVLWRGDEDIDIKSVKEVIVTNKVTMIKDDAFSGCKNLNKVQIADTVTLIGERVFRRCTSLINVEIPNSVTEIGKEAFAHCVNMTAVTIPENLSELKFETFYGCESLGEINIPYKVQTIGDSAFEYCEGLTSVTLPESVKTIENEAFKKCTKLQNIDLPDGLEKIGMMAFAYDTSLDSVLIPSKISKIEEYTFLGCSALGYVVIPSAVESIGERAFGDCSNLSSIWMIKDTPAQIGDAAFGILSPEAKIYVPKEAVEAYKAAPNWSDYSDNITTFEKGYSFDKATATLTITSEIGTRLWKEKGSGIDPASVKHLIIENGTRAIMQEAFDGCANIKTAKIADSVTLIDDHAFSGCSGLMALNLPANLETIGWGAFSECNNSEVTQIIIPKSVKKINNYAFLGCTSVKTYVVEGDIPAELGGRVFDVDRTDYTILVPAGKLAVYQEAWPVYADRMVAVETSIVFQDLTANGTSGTAQTTQLTLNFDKDITGLTAGDITLTGAAKGDLIKGSKTGEYKLSISGISVKNGEGITVKVDKAGYRIEPASKTVAVFIKQVGPAPTPNDGDSNVKTGTTDTPTDIVCAVVFLSLAGLVAFGFKRRVNR